MAHAITVKVRPLAITLLVLVLLAYFIYTSDFAGQGALDHVPVSLTKPRKHPNVHNDDPNEPLAPWHNSSKLANAIIVIIGSDSDFDAVRYTMRQVETKFNSVYNYPYLFLDKEGFSTKFRKATTSLTEGTTYYGYFPNYDFSYPSWVDKEQADRNRDVHGENLSNQLTARYNAGFFFRHPLLNGYDYYWRIDPSVEFLCNIDYDPFVFMEENDIKFSWTLALNESEKTMPTLWKTVKSFMHKYSSLIPKKNRLDFISDDGGRTYNTCYFGSNLEIGSLNFFRSSAYLRFFEYLDRTGGFFYEKWNDAAIHSIAATMLLSPSEIHYFDDMGYRKSPFTHCPLQPELQLKCHCVPEKRTDSCAKRWFRKN